LIVITNAILIGYRSLHGLKGMVEVGIIESLVDIRIVPLETITPAADLLRSCAHNTGGQGKLTLIMYFPWLPLEVALLIFNFCCYDGFLRRN
jgi:hypothetical protein